MAKALIDFFDKKYKKKKKVTVETNRSSAATMDLVVEDGEDYEGEDADLADILAASETPQERAIREAADVGQSAVDDHAVSMTRARAVRDMAAQGVVISAAQQQSAIKIFPKISGLAIKIRDSGPIRHIWDKTVVEHPPNPKYGAQLKYPARRNTTRWDSEFDCLTSSRAFADASKAITSNKDLKLQTFKLTVEQNNLANDLHDMLSAFKTITSLFQSGATLIIEVLPAFHDLDVRLKMMANDVTLAPVCRVAAYAAHLQCDKYYDLFSECEAVAFCIACCPDRKLQWFRDRGWNEVQIAKLRQDIIDRFRSCYRTTPPTLPAETITSTSGADRWAPPQRTPIFHDPNNIETYLDADPIPTLVDQTVLQYWDCRLQRTPDVARFCLSYISAPGKSFSLSSSTLGILSQPLYFTATSVEPERTFSKGRNQIDWNQQSMGQDTFNPRMVMESWADAPWFDLNIAARVLEENCRPLRSKT
ncbi:uncharacterized protein STEHIDRAFT_164101 [Stereum hirsutum FP-91666 SS1]|uniref:HAT C-terminal dimerisation domain-containing protein n=1 Tax=Stereum hirsutum (strain FP-91666) TaxID=721885 RepID=R7RVG5_STEHR|nr:uncharacterized protein STEHIDRAFT_164101 [Stereum hirsutum FP-91666 SS1]EIM79011.1 hypothetical protein STEHIDRAFT_164101 [Stereum hirsutum FP-91666 SS1]